MQKVFAHKALLPDGWSDAVMLDIEDGCLQSVAAGQAQRDADTVVGFAIPGLTNAHSHAFQRALAGHTEERSPAGRDSFWTWRERMYALAAVVDAPILYALARQAYSEMLEAGYTAVAEFHYLHREPGSDELDDAMFDALRRAADDSGIRLTYVPVLYERAGFDRPQPEGSQRLFALTLEQFLQHYERVQTYSGAILNIGIGAHSLRAVSDASLKAIAGVASKDDVPLHLHIAEQQREVDQCMAANSRRPVRWLLENYEVNRNWCLVHATHMDEEEAEALAQTEAVACLCPSTEANLGDGLFRLRRFLAHGGNIAIGSDSHVSINPFEELRWLEYGQRLATQSRNVASLQDAHVGSELFVRSLRGGLQAGSRNKAGLQAGAPADFVALYAEDPMLLGHSDASILDALVFSGYRLPIERVMVNGTWCVEDGMHRSREPARAAYKAALGEIGAAS